jgi:beta-lactamase regulating signal transducer with metallopeptidase domain
VITVLVVNSFLCAICALVAFAPAAMARHAATRYILWYLALAASVAAPPLTLLLQPTAPLRLSTSAAVSASWPASLLAAWVVGVLAAVARMSLALVRSRQLLRGGIADARVTRIADDVKRELGTTRAFDTRLSPHVTSPHFVGLWRPTVVLPLSFRHVDNDPVRAVLLHEVAHVLRRDDFLIASEQLAQAVLFFNPAIRLIRRRLERERELACDELACSRVAVSRYVSVLLVFARKAEAGFALAAGPTALTWRVRMLLTRREARWRNDALGVWVAICGAFYLACAGVPHLARRVAAPAASIAVRARPSPHEPVRAVPADAIEDGALHFANGWSLLNIGQYDGAIEELAKARDLGYEPYASAANLAVAYAQKGDVRAARGWRARAMEAPRGTYPSTY